MSRANHKKSAHHKNGRKPTFYKSPWASGNQNQAAIYNPLAASGKGRH